MNTVFTTILNLSVSAGLVALCVILFRFAFTNSKKWVNCLLWSLVALRLLLPFSAGGIVDLLPAGDGASTQSPTIQTPVIQSPVTQPPVVQTPDIQPPVVGGDLPTVDPSLPPVLTNPSLGTSAPLAEATPWEIFWSIAPYLWLAGVAVMAVYGLTTYLRLARKVRPSLRLKENIFYCDDVDSPFVLGIFRPRIYLPSGLLANKEQMENVIAHEKAHQKRLDHIWKPLGFALLALHWFNPVLWVSFALMNRDIESACDEKVIQNMTELERASYAETLMGFCKPRAAVKSCPVAFGESAAYKRIKAVLFYKKPAKWLVALSLVAAMMIAVFAAMLNPVAANEADPVPEVGESETTTEGETTTLEGETTEEPKPSTPLEDYGIDGEYVELVAEYEVPVMVVPEEAIVVHGDKYRYGVAPKGMASCLRSIFIPDKETFEEWFYYVFRIEVGENTYITPEDMDQIKSLYAELSKLDFEQYQIIVTIGVKYDYNKANKSSPDCYEPKAFIRQGDYFWFMFDDYIEANQEPTMQHRETRFYVFNKSDIPDIENFRPIGYIPEYHDEIAKSN